MPGDITSEFGHDSLSRAPDPSPVGNTNYAGWSPEGARGDHSHAYGRMMGGTVKSVAGVGIPNASLTTLTWDTFVTDPEIFIKTYPAQNIVVPLGCSGRYLVTLAVFSVAGTDYSGTRQFITIVSSAVGNPSYRLPMERAGAGAVSGIFELNAGDFFNAQIFQTSTFTVTHMGNLEWIRLGPIS